jgi:glycosyltransferase involved in cell wall biosynthesis
VRWARAERSRKAAAAVRILHTESSLGWGGPELRILTEAAGMRRRGHDVRIASTREAPIFTAAERFGVPVLALPIRRAGALGVVALRRALACERFDIVNSHSGSDSWLAALACRAGWLGKQRPPALVHTRHYLAPLPRGAATRWLYARAMAEIVTTGEALREEVIRDTGVSPARVASIPTGIDLERFAPGDWLAARRALPLRLPEHVPLVGIVAPLRRAKGHRYLVEAMTLLARRETELVIVGDGPERDALAAQVHALGLDARVHLVGEEQDVAPWLRALDVFALPSYAHEGVPQALLQAMAVGIACVTTDVGAIGEIAIHDVTALVVAKENSVALAAGIDRLLDAAALRERLTWSARERAQSKFGIAAMLDAMEAVFRRAADANRYR